MFIIVTTIIKLIPHIMNVWNNVILIIIVDVYININHKK